MALEINPTPVDGEKIATMTGAQETSPGTIGLQTQVPGQPTTVSEVASATGGMQAGTLIQVDLDKELFEFESDDTPLMQLMLRAKKVSVDAPVVDHYMLDEAKAMVTTTEKCGGESNQRALLPLESAESQIPRPFFTLLCLGVNGYDRTGQTETEGRPLMLFVTGTDNSTGYPIVSAVNGPKTNDTDEDCNVPEIPAGTECVILANACHETQKWVDPDIVVPVPERVYLQKRIMNQIVSDYFESQKKRIPFTKAIIAEHALKTFKQRCNRTLWFSRKGMKKIAVPNMGMQTVYFTEGVRWQFKRELTHSGTNWTYEEFIALAKMFYTGEDVPSGGYCLCGKNFLESIQKIDWSKHPEVRIEVTTNNLGWSITKIHTVFGDLQFKREPTLDRAGYSNSCGIFGEGRLVHYARTAEHNFSEAVEGHEAKRDGIILWDGLALKGSCHIWVDGEGNSLAGSNPNSVAFEMWSEETAPESPVADMVYYFLVDCKLTDDLTANAGDMYQWKDGAWVIYKGEIFG